MKKTFFIFTLILFIQANFSFSQETIPLVYLGKGLPVDLIDTRLAQKAHILKAHKKFNLALEEYDKVIQQYPNSKSPRLGKAMTLVELNQIDQAIIILDELVKEFPDDNTGYFGLLKIYTKLGDEVKELAILKEIVRIEPIYYTFRSRIKELEGDLVMAEEILTANLEAKPLKHKVPSYIALGEFYERQGRLNDAKIQYTEGKKLMESGGYPSPFHSKKIEATLERLKNQ